MRQPGDSFDSNPSVRGEQSLCAVCDLYDGHASVRASAKTYRTGDGFAVGRPRRALLKKVGMPARGQWLFSRAIRIRHHQLIFFFQAASKSEPLAVRREAKGADRHNSFQ